MKPFSLTLDEISALEITLTLTGAVTSLDDIHKGGSPTPYTTLIFTYFRSLYA